MIVSYSKTPKPDVEHGPHSLPSRPGMDRSDSRAGRVMAASDLVREPSAERRREACPRGSSLVDLTRDHTSREDARSPCSNEDDEDVILY